MEEIKRDFLPESMVWDILVNKRNVSIWEDGDIVFELMYNEREDILLSSNELHQILNAANDYWVARTRYKEKQAQT